MAGMGLEFQNITSAGRQRLDWRAQDRNHGEIWEKPCKSLVNGSNDGKGDSWKNQDRCGRRNEQAGWGKRGAKVSRSLVAYITSCLCACGSTGLELAQLNLVWDKFRFVPSISHPGITITHGISSQFALLPMDGRSVRGDEVRDPSTVPGEPVRKCHVAIPLFKARPIEEPSPNDTDRNILCDWKW